MNKNNIKLGIVVSYFNRPITERLEQGALNELKKRAISEEQYKLVVVPGAYEIPLAAKWFLDQGYDGVVTLGAVIRGETTHYDYVCNSVERGCTQLQLETGKPVIFGVLTTEDKEQALARSGGNKCDKGQEAVEAFYKMLEIKDSILT